MRDLLETINFPMLGECRCSRWRGNVCPCGADPFKSLRGVVAAGAVGYPACRHRLPYLRPRQLRCIECSQETNWTEWWAHRPSKP